MRPCSGPRTMSRSHRGCDAYMRSRRKPHGMGCSVGRARRMKRNCRPRCNRSRRRLQRHTCPSCNRADTESPVNPMGYRRARVSRLHRRRAVRRRSHVPARCTSHRYSADRRRNLRPKNTAPCSREASGCSTQRQRRDGRPSPPRATHCCAPLTAVHRRCQLGGCGDVCLAPWTARERHSVRPVADNMAAVVGYLRLKCT